MLSLVINNRQPSILCDSVAGQSHHHRHSGESRNPEAEFVNPVSDSFIHTIMDSGFRRSDGRLTYDAIALTGRG